MRRIGVCTKETESWARGIFQVKEIESLNEETKDHVKELYEGERCRGQAGGVTQAAPRISTYTALKASDLILSSMGNQWRVFKKGSDMIPLMPEKGHSGLQYGTGLIWQWFEVAANCSHPRRPMMAWTGMDGSTGSGKSRFTGVGVQDTVYSCIIIYSLLYYFPYEQL